MGLYKCSSNRGLMPLPRIDEMSYRLDGNTREPQCTSIKKSHAICVEVGLTSPMRNARTDRPSTSDGLAGFRPGKNSIA